jgi:hypothetical protein
MVKRITEPGRKLHADLLSVTEGKQPPAFGPVTISPEKSKDDFNVRAAFASPVVCVFRRRGLRPGEVSVSHFYSDPMESKSTTSKSIAPRKKKCKSVL